MTDDREAYRLALVRAISEARPFIEAVRELRKSVGVDQTEGRRVRLALAASMLLAAAEDSAARMDSGTLAMVAILIDPSL
jgi:hypothetical protein